MLTIVEGNLLNATEQVIVQQINCLCVKPHGLSQTIANRYPYANFYAKRRRVGTRNLAVVEDRPIPGSICVSHSPTNGPIVIGLCSQYDYGRPGKSYRTKIQDDNFQLREKWFCQSLNLLSTWLIENNIKGVAFPYMIGCGLGGGNWNNYLNTLTLFAQDKLFEVVLYRL